MWDRQTKLIPIKIFFTFITVLQFSASALLRNWKIWCEKWWSRWCRSWSWFDDLDFWPRWTVVRWHSSTCHLSEASPPGLGCRLAFVGCWSSARDVYYKWSNTDRSGHVWSWYSGSRRAMGWCRRKTWLVCGRGQTASTSTRSSRSCTLRTRWRWWTGSMAASSGWRRWLCTSESTLSFDFVAILGDLRSRAEKFCNFRRVIDFIHLNVKYKKSEKMVANVKGGNTQPQFSALFNWAKKPS